MPSHDFVIRHADIWGDLCHQSLIEKLVVEQFGNPRRNFASATAILP
jgi:hypothetical protein